MIIIKLGGSIITDKSRYRTFRRAHTERIIKELARIEDQIILVHGGGSFGHIMAREYGIPGRLTEKRRIGAAIIHKDMVDLNQSVSEILIDHGISSISIPPSSFIFGEESNYEIFRKYMDSQITPVSFGDVFLSSEGNIGIYSGDRLMLDLARIFSPSKAVFISDVDGIYDKNPKLHKDAKLLKSIYDDAVFELDVADVTGGIKGKLETMKQMKEYVPEIYMLNGAEPQRLRKMGTENFLGTMIS